MLVLGPSSPYDDSIKKIRCLRHRKTRPKTQKDQCLLATLYPASLLNGSHVTRQTPADCEENKTNKNTNTQTNVHKKLHYTKTRKRVVDLLRDLRILLLTDFCVLSCGLAGCICGIFSIVKQIEIATFVQQLKKHRCLVDSVCRDCKGPRRGSQTDKRVPVR